MKILIIWLKIWFWLECLGISTVFYIPPLYEHSMRMVRLNVFRLTVELGLDNVYFQLGRDNDRELSND